MSIYKDDQCEECGGIRAPGSRLCIGCMVRQIVSLECEVRLKDGRIEALENRVFRCLKILAEVKAFNQGLNRMNGELWERVSKILDELR